jgi:hypothetical protein
MKINIMGYHDMPIGMTIIKTARDNKYWQECGEKVTFVYCQLECKLVVPVWKMVWRIFKIEGRAKWLK